MKINVRRIRDRLGESQAEFAKRFGVDQGTICRWEKKTSPPGPAIVLLRQIERSLKSGTKLIQAAE